MIPTYKPGKKFSRLLKMLQRQTWPVGKIIVMNTEKSFWNEHGFEGIKNLEVHHLTKEEFDHQDIVQGGTLEFQMGPNPNTNWGASALSLPPDNMK